MKINEEYSDIIIEDIDEDTKKESGKDAGSRKEEETGASFVQQPEESYYDRLRRLKEEEKQTKKKFRPIYLLFILIPVFIIAAMVVFSVTFTEDKSWKDISGAGTQYYQDASAPIRSDTQLKVDESGNVISRNDSEQIAEVPIYLNDTTAFVLTETMAYYDPRQGINRRADSLTEFTVGESGAIYAAKDGVKKRVSTGFLYNGSDMFIFLEPMVIEVNNYTVRVPALSYVEAVSGDRVVIFNYETKESEVFVPETEVSATSEDGAYSVLLLEDAWIRPDGARLLLFFAPEKLESLI